MDNWYELAIAGLGTGGTVVAGLWALMRKLIDSQEKMQSIFLSHLEKKNGHTERIADNFNKTTKKIGESVVKSNQELKSEIRLLTQAHKQK